MQLNAIKDLYNIALLIILLFSKLAYANIRCKYELIRHHPEHFIPVVFKRVAVY